ncbi:hypothetical protein YC2023_058721 [Brassica napus]
MLKVLVVANSRLTGSMSRWLSKSTNLELLDLSAVSRFPNLSSRDISDARSLQSKHFFRLPPTLQLSQNNLSGPIWEDLGKLKKLHVANLNGNRLSGTIPSSLSEMTTLEVLDLSNNRFSGSIPESLQKLTFLSMFSVANNSLSGRIPSGGHFQTFPDSSYEGNDFFFVTTGLNVKQVHQTKDDQVPVRLTTVIKIYNIHKLYMLTYAIYGLYTNRRGFLFDNRSRRDMKALLET